MWHQDVMKWIAKHANHPLVPVVQLGLLVIQVVTLYYHWDRGSDVLNI
jgi:hypothetical protein